MLLEVSIAIAVGAAVILPDTFVAKVVSAAVVVPVGEKRLRNPIADGPTT